MTVTSTTKQVCNVAEELLNSFMNSKRESLSRELFIYSFYIMTISDLVWLLQLTHTCERASCSL